MKKLVSLLLALALAGAMLAGCGGKAESGSTSTDAAPRDSLQLMWTAQKGTDSIFESPWKDLQCLYPYMVFDRLISAEADGTVADRLAEAHTVSEDGLTYTFTLREGLTWSDGEPVTADDVAFTFWGVLADPVSSYKSLFLAIEGADATVEDGSALAGVTTDGNTVTVKLAKPSGLFLSAVAKMFILPQHLLGDTSATDLSTTEAYWKKPVGCGAYVVDEVSFPDYCTLTRSASYWGEPAGIEKVTLTSYATGGSDAATNALVAGTLDLAYGNEYNDISIAKNVASLNGDVTYLEMVSNYQRQFLFNWVTSADGKLNPDFAKKEVRQAVNMLLDKDAIAALYGENAVALTSHLNPGSAMYDATLTPFKRDVEGAKALLAAAGFDFTRPVRIAYYYDNQVTKEAMDLVVQNLADAGITAEATLLQGDLGTLIYEDRNYDMLFCGEAADDAGQMYMNLLGVGGYFDAIIGDMDARQTLFNDVVDKYLATGDLAEQTALAATLQQNGVDLCAIAPVVGIKTLTIYNGAHVEVPADVFAYDWSTRDWHFEAWKLK